MSGRNTHYFLFLLLFLLFRGHFLYAQEYVRYQLVVTDIAQKLVSAFPVSVAGEKVEYEQEDGPCFVRLRSDLRQISPSEVIFPEKKYNTQRVRISSDNQTIYLLVNPSFYLWSGRLLSTEGGLPIPGVFVHLPEFPSISPGKTNRQGDFKLKISSGTIPTEQTKVAVNGLVLPQGASDFFLSSRFLVVKASEKVAKRKMTTYEKGDILVLTEQQKPLPHTVVRIGDEAYVTDKAGRITARLPTNIEAIKLKLSNHKLLRFWGKAGKFTAIVRPVALSSPLPSPASADSSETQAGSLLREVDSEITEIIESLAAEKHEIGEKNTVLRRKIDAISKRLNEKTNITPQQKAGLQALLHKFQRQLYENERAFNMAQQENQAIIAQMAELLQGKDSANLYLQEQNLLEKQKNQKLSEEKKNFRNLSMVLAVGSVLFSAIAAIFYLVSKRDREQKRRISNQADKLLALNHRISKQSENITDSLRYAKTIQLAFLPDIKKLKTFFSDFFVVYSPKDIVSGDFFWFAKNEKRKFIAVVDCTGHGVPGAFMSIIGSTILSRIVNEMHVTETDQVLEILNKEIIQSLRQEEQANDDGMDVCLCAIEEHGDEREIHFTGAKRPLFFIQKRNKIVNMHRGDVKSVGGMRQKKKKFTATKITLAKGDCMFLSSDGLVDQNNAQKIKFGTKKLIEFLEENQDMPMEDMGKTLETALKTHQGEVLQRDDITFLGIRF